LPCFPAGPSGPVWASSAIPDPIAALSTQTPTTSAMNWLRGSETGGLRSGSMPGSLSGRASGATGRIGTVSPRATQPTDPREARAQRIQDRFEWPVVCAALLTVPILVIQESDLAMPWPEVARVLNWVTWSIFLLEAVVMLAVVPDRWRWLKRHLIDVAVVVITPPFAPAGWQSGRLFRLVRLLRLVRVLAIRRLLSLEGMRYAGVVAVATVIVGGAVFSSVEEGHGITTWDGVWWAVTTVTTVGYGEIEVHSTAGRIIGITIMFVGIGFVALLTAFIAERFISAEEETEEKADLILAELRALHARLDALESGGESRRAPDPRLDLPD
jgi:voltage-gated potassium channel